MIYRKTAVLSAALLGLGVLGLAPPAFSQLKVESYPTTFNVAGVAAVAVTGGSVSGMRMPSGVAAYLGIPYAAPPIGPLRWRAPQPPIAWQGVRPTVNYSATCTQDARGPGQNHYFGPEPTGEDCLYLNIWTPKAVTPSAKLPVVVYIHGGGFTSGAGSQAWARGEGLATKGVIAVSINYRLGGLGFMAHPALTAESGGRGSGDYGLLDQIQALRWVQQNIGKFGGDPQNVTIMGQSAGSMALSILGASPQAKGLFQREIGMSGSSLSTGTGSVTSLADAERSGVALQAKLGAKSIDDLRRLPADKVVAAQGVRFGPNVDGLVLPETPQEIFAAGKQNDVGLLVGFTHDEAFNGLSGATSAESYTALANRLYPEQATELLKLYPADANWRVNSRAAARDLSLGISMWNWAKGQAATGTKPVYAYQFTRVHPYAKGVTFIDHDPQTAGAYHAGEIVYWTGTLDAFNSFRHTRDWSATDLSLSNSIMDMVVAFAKNGNPNTPKTPAVRFDAANARMLELGETIRVIDWPNREKMAFIAALPAPRAGGAPAAAPNPLEGGPRN